MTVQRQESRAHLPARRHVRHRPEGKGGDTRHLLVPVVLAVPAALSIHSFHVPQDMNTATARYADGRPYRPAYTKESATREPT